MDVNLSKILKSGEFSKKKRVNSKSKGNRFENDIVKKLNSKFGDNQFARTPGSGAFATTHSLPEHVEVNGDLITPKGFRYIIECKAGYKLDFHDFFKHKSTLLEFIKQAKRDSKKTGKDWLVIYKKDYQPVIVITGKEAPGIKASVVLNGNYFFYTFQDFIKLPEDFFFYKS